MRLSLSKLLRYEKQRMFIKTAVCIEQIKSLFCLFMRVHCLIRNISFNFRQLNLIINFTKLNNHQKGQSQHSCNVSLSIARFRDELKALPQITRV